MSIWNFFGALATALNPARPGMWRCQACNSEIPAGAGICPLCHCNPFEYNPTPAVRPQQQVVYQQPVAQQRPVQDNRLGWKKHQGWWYPTRGGQFIPGYRWERGVDPDCFVLYKDDQPKLLWDVKDDDACKWNSHTGGWNDWDAITPWYCYEEEDY